MRDRLIYSLAGALAYLIAFALCYLVGYFISMEWDLRQWSTAGRTMLVGVSMLVAAAWLAWNNRGAR